MRGRTSFIIAFAVLGGACSPRPKSARRPVQMVAMPPPVEAPHAQSSVPNGGARTFEADEVVSCEADTADIVRAYATKEALTIIGERPGRATLRLRLASGDVFLLDVVVTPEPSPYAVLAVGEQLAIPIDGVKDIAPPSACVRTTKNADGTQLFLLAEQPCTAIIGLTMQDGTTKATEIVVVGGERLL